MVVEGVLVVAIEKREGIGGIWLYSDDTVRKSDVARPTEVLCNVYYSGIFAVKRLLKNT